MLLPGMNGFASPWLASIPSRSLSFGPFGRRTPRAIIIVIIRSEEREREEEEKQCTEEKTRGEGKGSFKLLASNQTLAQSLSKLRQLRPRRISWCSRLMRASERGSELKEEATLA